MLRITTSHSAEGAKKYFDVSLKTSDYYTKDMGKWGGKGAAAARDKYRVLEAEARALRRLKLLKSLISK